MSEKVLRNDTINYLAKNPVIYITHTIEIVSFGLTMLPIKTKYHISNTPTSGMRSLLLSC